VNGSSLPTSATDIVQDLAGGETEFFKHYPQFKVEEDEAKRYDRGLYDKLLEVLRRDGIMRFVRETNMAGVPFERAQLDPLYEFLEGWSSADREFIDPDLEAWKKGLWDQVVIV
jgi:hypothetical protein